MAGLLSMENWVSTFSSDGERMDHLVRENASVTLVVNSRWSTVQDWQNPDTGRSDRVGYMDGSNADVGCNVCSTEVEMGRIGVRARVEMQP